MPTNATSYINAAFPPPLHKPDLRDEDVAAILDESDKRSKAARKAQETRRQKQAEQAASQESMNAK